MPANPRRGKLALVVEDDRAVGELLAMLLRDEGYRVIAVPDLERATRVIRLAMPSLITLDLCLSDACGPRVLEQLARLDLCRSVPILLITSEARWLPSWVRSKVFRAIDKPFDIDEVIAAAEEAVRLGPVPAPARGN